jgi:hypothetical protein
LLETRKKKQAVVIIHGVGEQVPLDTLRGFINAVWTSDCSLRRPNVPAEAWSKPDVISGSYELRRMTTAENRDKRRTDFFEFYWAHLMEGTTLSHLRAWAKVLIFRWPWRVPRQLRGIWALLVVGVLFIMAAILNYYVEWIKIPAWVLKAGVVAWALLGGLLIGFLVHVAGDAARYLHVAPPNIEIRRRIRQAGIDLLENLHSSSQYDRIILVGHSLGSVIGYDVITHLWARYHDSHVASPGNGATPALDALEVFGRAAAEGKQFDLEKFQSAQSSYLAELQSHGNEWLISDFVTLGSPLTHASVLMAKNEQELILKKNERQFPTCPPVLEDISVKNLKQKKFTFESNHVWVPHHAAAFAPTRWTNLYFPCKRTFWGDVIGGPLAQTFGSGIRDIAVETNLRRGFFSHTLYWACPKNKAAGTERQWLITLRQAVRICQNPVAAKPPMQITPNSN